MRIFKAKAPSVWAALLLILLAILPPETRQAGAAISSAFSGFPVSVSASDAS